MMSTSALYRLCATGLVALFTSGCAHQGGWGQSWFGSDEEPQVPVVVTGEPQDTVEQPGALRYRPDSRDNAILVAPPVAVYQTPTELYRSHYTHKGIGGYAEQLAMELLDNAKMLNAQSKIGIASFVLLDKSLQRSDVLGNQLAEVFIHELQHYGVAVVDFKTMDAIAVEQRGDFVFSRDTERLAQQLNLDFVLSGTMVRNERGVKLNTRMVSMHDKVVVSSASVMIPHFIVAQLVPDYLLRPTGTWHY